MARVAGFLFVMACWMLGSTTASAATGNSLATAANVNNSWAGTSMYYLWACDAATQNQYLAAMQKANLRVLRIFILASCTTVSSTCQGANSCQTFPDVESPAVGAWNDTVLQRVDDLMLRATQYGVKLTIALHDRWSLGCWRYDAYVAKYNLTVSTDCGRSAESSVPDTFYTSPAARRDFAARLTHILRHVNPHFGAAWAQLPQAVFSWQAENEPRWGAAPDWLAFASGVIKQLSPGIPVSSGGPEGGLPAPDPKLVAAVPAVDILSFHDYANEIPAKVAANRAAALAAGKRYMLEEFGFAYNGPGNEPLRAQQFANATAQAMQPFAAPWLFWMLGDPVNQPNSLDNWPGQLPYDSVLAPNSAKTAQLVSEQSWPEIWGNGKD